METRLNLLCGAGVIDKDICKGMMQVVKILEIECHLPVRSEQGTMAMTHMASALMRSRRGEEIEPLDDELADRAGAIQPLVSHFTIASGVVEGIRTGS